MNNLTPIEIERKFLILMPNADLLKACEGVRVKRIKQTYLASNDGKNARVRKIEEDQRIYFIKTVKEKISSLSSYENEYEITEAQYSDELKNADKGKNPIIKTRFCIPYENHVIEIDVYPFWTDRAILEVELDGENEDFTLPPFIRVIKEVSEDKRYKNTMLAQSVPFDDLTSLTPQTYKINQDHENIRE